MDRVRRTSLLIVFLVAAACSSKAPTPTPAATPTSAATKPDAHNVNVEALLRPGTVLKETLYADMDGDGIDEIAVFSQAKGVAANNTIPAPYVDVYSIVNGRPVNVFDAAQSDALQAEQGVVDQHVQYMSFVRFAGKPDLVLGVENIGSGAGPLVVWVWSWGKPFKQEFRYSTTVDGNVTANTDQLVLETGSYKSTDPMCCPSGKSHIVIGSKEGKIGIVSETTTKS